MDFTNNFWGTVISIIINAGSIILILGVVIGAPIYLISSTHKANKAKELAKKAAYDNARKNFDMHNLTATQTIQNLLIDEDNLQFAILPNMSIHHVKDLTKIEMSANNERYVVKGGVARAIVGGALFGEVGAIVGANTATTQKVEGNITFYFYFDNRDCPVAEFEYHQKYGTGIADYKLEINRVMSIFNNMMLRVAPVAEDSAVKSDTAISSADEIMKFKKLLDDGVITQEEFEQKKKQLLNL